MKLPYGQTYPTLWFYRYPPERLERLEQVLLTTIGGTGLSLELPAPLAPVRPLPVINTTISLVSTIVLSFATRLECASLRGLHALHDSPLPSLSHSMLRHVQRWTIPRARFCVEPLV